MVRLAPGAAVTLPRGRGRLLAVGRSRGRWAARPPASALGLRPRPVSAVTASGRPPPSAPPYRLPPARAVARPPRRLPPRRACGRPRRRPLARGASSCRLPTLRACGRPAHQLPGSCGDRPARAPRDTVLRRVKTATRRASMTEAHRSALAPPPSRHARPPRAARVPPRAPRGTPGAPEDTLAGTPQRTCVSFVPKLDAVGAGWSARPRAEARPERLCGGTRRARPLAPAPHGAGAPAPAQHPHGRREETALRGRRTRHAPSEPAPSARHARLEQGAARAGGAPPQSTCGRHAPVATPSPARSSRSSTTTAAHAAPATRNAVVSTPSRKSRAPPEHDCEHHHPQRLGEAVLEQRADLVGARRPRGREALVRAAAGQERLAGRQLVQPEPIAFRAALEPERPPAPVEVPGPARILEHTVERDELRDDDAARRPSSRVRRDGRAARRSPCGLRPASTRRPSRTPPCPLGVRT